MVRSLEFVDADAHVIEGPTLGAECRRRWTDAFTPGPGGSLLTERRRYPEPEGPGAGCPPEHGTSTAAGIDFRTPEGVLADADRDGIDELVFLPSYGI